MADVIFGTIFNTVPKIISLVKKVQGNTKEGENIIKMVTELSENLKLLQSEPKVMKDETVRRAMDSLEKVVVGIERKVEKMNKSNVIMKVVNANTMAKELTDAKYNLWMQIIMAGYINGYNMISKLNAILDMFPRQDQAREDYDAANRKNTAAKTTTGLISYHRSVLEAALLAVSNGGGGSSTASTSSANSVYKCILNNEQVIIEKCQNGYEKESFVDHLNLGLKLQHKNIATVLGYCYEYYESLVQEDDNVRVEEKLHLYFVSRDMSGQSLSRFIKECRSVDWASLFQIILGIAEGLVYMHHNSVIHLDLKPESILLDSNMTPMITDFGRARKHTLGADEITPGNIDYCHENLKYMAQELCDKTPRASTKSDVYSFGAILLETISIIYAGEPAQSPKSRNEWVRTVQKCECKDLFDGKLLTDEYQLAAATRCVLVGVMCCEKDPVRRPTMPQVLDQLAGSRKGKEIKSSDQTTTMISSGTKKLKKTNKKKKKKASSPSLQAARSINTPVPAAKVQEDTYGRSTRTQAQAQGHSLISTTPSYNIFTQEEARKMHDDLKENLEEVLSIPPAVAEVLLMYCNWSPERAIFGWSQQQEGVEEETLPLRSLLRLPAAGFPKRTVLSADRYDGMSTCTLFSDHDDGPVISTGCTHYYCNKCWRRYICWN